jgi:hypothetical protein
MNDEQKQFFASMENMFLTPGWQLVSKGWQEEQAQLADIVFHNAKSMDDVLIARTRYELLGELVNLPSTIAMQREHLDAEENV